MPEQHCPTQALWLMCEFQTYGDFMNPQIMSSDYQEAGLEVYGLSDSMLDLHHNYFHCSKHDHIEGVTDTVDMINLVPLLLIHFCAYQWHRCKVF